VAEDERAQDGPPARAGRTRRRSRIATVLAVLLTVSFTGGLLAGWAESTVFDEQHFADRSVRLLDSAPVREELADKITEALVQNGPSQIASFQSVIRPVLADVLETPAFKQIFRNAMLEAHHALFTEDGNAAVINLSQALGVLSGSLQISNPDVAQNIPTGANQFLVDFSDQIRGLQLWQAGEDLDAAAEGLLSFSLVLAIVIVVISGDVRRGLFKVGVAAVAAGLLLVVVAVLAPRLASLWISDPALASAIRSGVGIFVGDLQVLGVWVIGYGVVTAALVTASVPQHEPVDARWLWANLTDRARAWQPTSTAGRTTRAAVVALAGIVLILQRDAVVPLAVAVIGAYVTYVGVVMLLAIVGRTPAARAVARAEDHRGEDLTEPRSPWPRLVGTGVALALVVSILGVGGTVWARGRADAVGQRACNGHPELCDRRIDEVAFPGSHNSMSASRDPGWLFAENTYGIPAQLEYGIRALLVKTHYGIPAGINVTGTELVVTDRAAEIAVNPTVAEGQLPPGSAERAQQLSQSTTVDPARRDLYLCHVYCEYGATRFSTALTYIKQFLDQNPNEVIIFFIGDYVSTDDTAKAFQSVGLFDRLWEYDATQPAPTLGEMIDQRRNILMLSEFSGTPPAWNNPGYGLFQDTPYTFTEASQLYVQGAGPNPTSPLDTTFVSDTTIADDDQASSGTTIAFGKDWSGQASCGPNRGTPDSPLFQINHWVTPAGAAPTIAQAQEVNAYDVLMPRVRSCMDERGMFPTIIGVNFYDHGDLMKVVDEINGVAR
jgi:hypothetical protein